MSQKENVIEINGKRYDALSGKLLGDATVTVGRKPSPSLRTGHSVDGLMGKKPLAHAVQPATKAQPVAVAKPVQPAKAAVAMKSFGQYSDIIRTPATKTPRHKTAPSQTLMRHAVTKPAQSLRRQTKVQQRTDVLIKQPSITVTPKLSSYAIDPRRVDHAKQVAKHPEANRYAQPRPVIATPVKVTATPKPVAVSTQKPPVAARTAKQPADIFEQALARANSHIEQPAARRHTKHRRAFLGGRALSVGAASLAVLLIVGFFGLQQKASLTMRYAASKSGVAASLPGYKPAGFSAGKFSYSPGLVAVNFNNAKTGESFALIEKSSSWDSQALLDSFVATKSRTYQTIDAAGRTIYTYDGNSATWVDKGVWYQVNSKGSLTTNQLVQLALSM